MSGIYVALGSNLGDRLANLQRALELMPPEVEIDAVSSVYLSPPQPPAAPPAYYNAVCRVRTTLQPEALLGYLKAIEQTMGRRASEHWGPRVIDLDLILYNDEVVNTATLTIPHPRMAQRAFVLKPLLELVDGVLPDLRGASASIHQNLHKLGEGLESG